MKLNIFKIVLFVMGLMFMMGAVMPFLISNDMLPIWADMLIFTAMFMGWVWITEKIAIRIIDKIYPKEDEDVVN